MTPSTEVLDIVKSVGTFDPFELFKDAMDRDLKTRTSSVAMFSCFGLKVVAVDSMQTEFYDSCGNCKGFFHFTPGEIEACPFCGKYDKFVKND